MAQWFFFLILFLISSWLCSLLAAGLCFSFASASIWATESYFIKEGLTMKTSLLWSKSRGGSLDRVALKCETLQPLTKQCKKEIGKAVLLQKMTKKKITHPFFYPYRTSYHFFIFRAKTCQTCTQQMFDNLWKLHTTKTRKTFIV